MLLYYCNCTIQYVQLRNKREIIKALKIKVFFDRKQRKGINNLGTFTSISQDKISVIVSFVFSNDVTLLAYIE